MCGEDVSPPNAHFEQTVGTSKLCASKHNNLTTENHGDNHGLQNISEDISLVISIDTYGPVILEARDRISTLVNFLTRIHDTFPLLMPEICTTKPYQDYLARYERLLLAYEDNLNFLGSYQEDIDSQPLHLAKHLYRALAEQMTIAGEEASEMRSSLEQQALPLLSELFGCQRQAYRSSESTVPPQSDETPMELTVSVDSDPDGRLPLENEFLGMRAQEYPTLDLLDAPPSPFSRPPTQSQPSTSL
ncbi:hypothetical protein N7456_011503 [Penicillium angulare]|uniref:Uncharacterized protein n=1 Tax=Penicillium angulare TaxID=116970 RepID=A0A9W9K0R4_9EURO|nr:hypothetical protein N7456_011503 [Penicillium angulare]